MGDDNEQKPWERNYGGTATATEDEDVPWKKNYGATPPPSSDDEIDQYLKSGKIGETEPTEKNMPSSTPRLRAAVTAGKAKMTAPKDIESHQIPDYYGLTPGNIASAVGRGLGNVYEFGKNVVSDVAGIRSPSDLGNIAEKYVNKPQQEQADIASQYEEKAKKEPFLSREGLLDAITGTGHRIASVTPFVGPWVAGHAEQAGTGDIGGALGETAGEMAGGELAHRIGAHPMESARLAGKVADKVFRGTPITEEGKLAAAKQQALAVKKPSMTETEYVSKVDAALPDLQRVAQENKGEIKTPRAAVQGMNDRIAQIEAPISQHLDNIPDAQQALPAATFRPRIEQAIDDALAKRPGSYTQAEMDKAKKTVLDFVGDQDTTLKKVEGNRRRLNQDADQYFHADTAGKRAIDVSDATAVSQRAAANEIRNIEYGDANNPGELERIGVRATDTQGRPVNLRAVRKQVGNLIDVRDHFEDAITRAEATGDWSPFQVMRSGPSLAAGGLGAFAGGAAGGPFGAVLGILLGEGAKAWADYRASKNPNLNVMKMFRNLEGTRAPVTTDVTTTMPPPPVPPVPFQHTVGAATPPPPVPQAFRMQPTGTVGSLGQLGTRGRGGVSIAGLLPERIGQEATEPPPVAPQFQTEPIGNVTDPTRLGARGLGGIVAPRTGVAGLLPEHIDQTPAEPVAPVTPKPMQTGILRNIGEPEPEKAQEEATPRSKEETNAIRAELSQMKSKAKKWGDKIATARDWRKQREYMDNMGAADRRVAELQNALETGAPIKLSPKGYSKEELRSTYNQLDPQDKSQVQDWMQEYQMVTGLDKDRMTSEFELGRGDWKGLPLQEKMARHLKEQQSGTNPSQQLIRSLGGLPAKIGGEGREGTLDRLPERITTPAWVLNEGDTFIDDKGEPRSVESVKGGKVKTKDGTDRTYEDDVEHLGDINSPQSRKKK